MTRSADPDEEIWGTREELLLASAVSRHGAQNWDSVAMEVQKRSPIAPLVTAQTCEKRFHDLQRRFTAEKSGIDGEDSRGGGESDTISLLEELRKLHVAELRREVERYDVSILSLQLKVKELKADRERTLSEEQHSGERAPDPPEAEGKKKGAESPTRSTENAAADCASNGDIGRSCNESNSTGPKVAQDSDAATDRNPDGATVGAGSRDPAAADPITGDEEKLAGEGSYNGSSDTVAKGTEAATPADGPAATNPANQTDAGDSGESMAESKGEETSKEGSDVQSSASPSRRRFSRRTAASGVSSGGDDAEADEVSPPSKIIAAARSPPLAASFLEAFRSSKLGCTFERRLESQETTRYRSLIRQHMDLATVQGKMAEGLYAGEVELYRDLLLLCTNAVVFFPRDSMEHAAGVQLRELVRAQIAVAVQKAPPVPSTAAAEEPALPPAPPSPAGLPVVPETKMEPELSDSLLEKPNSDTPLVSCRKRSSVSAGKAAATVAAEPEEEEEEEAEEEEEEKPEPDGEEVEKTETKRISKERSSVVGVRRLRTGKGRRKANGAGNKKSPPANSAPAATENSSGSAKSETKNTSSVAAGNAGISAAKKRSAVNFLSRISRSAAASSSNGTLLETVKSPSGRGGKAAGGAQKKGGRKEQSSRQGSAAAASSGKQAQEQSVPVKRGVGRPPKRPPPPLPLPPAKRGRVAEADAPPPPRAASGKKRGRR